MHINDIIAMHNRGELREALLKSMYPGKPKTDKERNIKYGPGFIGKPITVKRLSAYKKSLKLVRLKPQEDSEVTSTPVEGLNLVREDLAGRKKKKKKEEDEKDEDEKDEDHEGEYPGKAEHLVFAQQVRGLGRHARRAAKVAALPITAPIKAGSWAYRHRMKQERRRIKALRSKRALTRFSARHPLPTLGAYKVMPKD